MISLSLSLSLTHTHTHTHYIYIYIYIFRERERERERAKIQLCYHRDLSSNLWQISMSYCSNWVYIYMFNRGYILLVCIISRLIDRSAYILTEPVRWLAVIQFANGTGDRRSIPGLLTFYTLRDTRVLNSFEDLCIMRATAKKQVGWK